MSLDENKYITMSDNLKVSGDINTNSLVSTTGNIYKGNSSGATNIWSDSFATAEKAGIVKVGDQLTVAEDGTLNANTDTLATKSELAGYLPVTSKAVANGVASLDANTKVPVAQIPDLSSTYATINSLATVATSGMYSDLTGTPSAATANTLGLVKPDGNTITVTEDGTISATGGSGSGSGFDFEGTKAEFDAAVAAGTITEDSVSLITDDVDGANVATKAELQAVDSSKADTSLSNLTTAGKEFASGLGMPSDGYINLKLGAADSMYIAPANGWLVLNATANNSSNFIQLKNVTSRITSSDYGTTNTTPLTTFLPVKTTDLINITYASISTTGVIFRFVYAKGAE